MDKRLETQSLLLTRERYLQYQTSQEYREAVKILAAADEDPNLQLTPKSFNCARDMLLFCINVRNGNRTGDLANMKVEEFNNRNKCHDRASGEVEYAIDIKENKTYSDFGYAKLVITPTLNHEMEIFLSRFRPFVMTGKPDHGYFFCTNKGNSLLADGKLSHCLSRHSKKAGLGHITSNTLRKSATTAAREYNPAMADVVATHMNHSRYTADRVYNLPDKNIAGIDAARLLDKIYSGEMPKPRTIEITDVGE